MFKENPKSSFSIGNFNVTEKKRKKKHTIGIIKADILISNSH